jgi:hypothetical protein
MSEQNGNTSGGYVIRDEGVDAARARLTAHQINMLDIARQVEISVRQTPLYTTKGTPLVPTQRFTPDLVKIKRKTTHDILTIEGFLFSEEPVTVQTVRVRQEWQIPAGSSIYDDYDLPYLPLWVIDIVRGYAPEFKSVVQ